MLGRIAYLRLSANLTESIAKGSREFCRWQHKSNRLAVENLVGTALYCGQAYSGVLLDELRQRDLREATAPARDCHCGLHARYRFVGLTPAVTRGPGGAPLAPRKRGDARDRRVHGHVR